VIGLVVHDDGLQNTDLARQLDLRIAPFFPEAGDRLADGFFAPVDGGKGKLGGLKCLQRHRWFQDARRQPHRVASGFSSVAFTNISVSV
jgi:hypothetical protein